jgi:hypothetical protein
MAELAAPPERFVSGSSVLRHEFADVNTPGLPPSGDPNPGQVFKTGCGSRLA